jgi:hypothetical protein
MKKIFLILTLAMGVVFGTNAQISTGTLQNAAKKASSVATSSGFDVNSLSSGIMSKLTTALTLTKTQKPQVLEIVTNFLQQKSSILSLATTNKTKYATKFAELTSTLNSKLKTVLTAAQLSKFSSLKPETNTASNVLSQLFY